MPVCVNSDYNLRNFLKQLAPSLVLFALWCLYVVAYYPGYMTFDSKVHFDQVMSGGWTTFQPVVFLGLWKLTHTLIAGPAGMFLLLLSVFSLGVHLFVNTLGIKWWQKVLAVVVVMLAPVNVMLLPHVWKDIALLAFLMLSLGLFQKSIQSSNRVLKVMALISLGLAMSFRFEAVLYLWPMVFYFVWPTSNGLDTSRKYLIVRTGVKTMAFIAVVFVSNALMSQISGAKKITLWPTMALWDLAAVSIEVDENLLPAFVSGPSMTVEDLTQAFEPWSNVPLFSRTKAGINTGIDLPYSDEQYQTLRQTWLQLPFNHSQAYIKHRWRVMMELLRINESKDSPVALYYNHTMSKYNGTYPKNDSQANVKIEQVLKAAVKGFYSKPWFYLLLGMLAVPLLLKKQGGQCKWQSSGLARALTACIVLNVLVMLFLAPAAESRYLIVGMNFSLLLWFFVFSTDPS
ncbi:hypothetical protein [Marinicella rhabdoformis]|uniref:hypothetical protein n=1 Tax=Marinicella rhabdoformis TaxID=2580566 RepID=UPI0012AEC84F|nr:hypothetical protein [Marinicella rhabdoformis]